MALSAVAQDVVLNNPQKPTEVTLPDGVVTEQNSLKKAFVAKAGNQALLFRPSENMPEIVNEDLLRGMSETGKTPNKVSDFIGYLPKLTVLPCAKGCEGSDYDAAVKQFIKAYNGDGKHFKQRGEMIVQVRWYHTRPWIQRGLPYGADIFGVSFIMEGKLVSLGLSSGIGTHVESVDLARNLGSRLAAELAYAAGLGLKPTFLRKVEKDALSGVGEALGNGLAAIHTTLGSEDVTPRIEPVTDANKQLLPAIDGIQPGEIDPITEVRYLQLLM